MKQKRTNSLKENLQPWSLLALIVVLALRCTQNPVQVPVSDISVAVDILSAEYVVSDSGASVRLTWNEPHGNGAEQLRYFRVYRTTAVDRNGNPVDFQSSGNQRVISGSARSFDDVVGLSNADYYYQVRAAAGDPENVVYGPATPAVKVRVGSGITFSINDGDIFTADSLCSLIVTDANGILSSWRFTDSFEVRYSYTMQDSTLSQVGNDQFVYVARVDTTKDTNEVVTGLVLVYDTATGIPVERVPVFSGVHHRANSNRLRSAVDGQTHYAYQWVLRQGGGTKYAFAELTYKDGNTDIREDDIAISPYRVEVKMRNETRKPIETMLELDDEYVDMVQKQVSAFTLVKPWVDFSISIYNDTTFLKDVTVYIATADAAARFSLSGNMVASNPLVYSLTGTGPLHNDQFVYHYPFSVDSARIDPNSASAHALSEIYRFDGQAFGEPIGTGSVSGNFDLLTKLEGHQVNFGRKEFSLVLEMKGRFFGEKRMIYSSARSGQGTISTYLDAYPPLLRMDRFEYEFPAPGDTLKGAFSLNTNTAGGYDPDNEDDRQNRGIMTDGGGSDIVAIDLYIAEMPASVRAAVDVSGTAALASLTESDLLGMRHRVLPFPIATPLPTVFPVAWNDVDPSKWNNGWYIFAIVAQDRYGNRGIAPFEKNEVSTSENPRTNPIYYFLLTGNAEF